MYFGSRQHLKLVEGSKLFKNSDSQANYESMIVLCFGQPSRHYAGTTGIYGARAIQTFEAQEISHRSSLYAPMAISPSHLRLIRSTPFICTRCSLKLRTSVSRQRWVHSTIARQANETGRAHETQGSVLDVLEERGFINQIAGYDS
jgi:hypothetical protein